MKSGERDFRKGIGESLLLSCFVGFAERVFYCPNFHRNFHYCQPTGPATASHLTPPSMLTTIHFIVTHFTLTAFCFVIRLPFVVNGVVVIVICRHKTCVGARYFHTTITLLAIVTTLPAV